MRTRALVAGALLVAAGCASVEPPVAVGPPPVALPTAPAAIEILDIGARSSLVPTGETATGGWEIPPLSRPEQASWFEPGPEPGDPGTSVILGHVNGNGKPGVFARLAELAEGDQITTTTVDGRPLHWVVYSVRVQPKAEFAPTFLRGDGPPVLVLMTCGGRLERTERGGRYVDNIVVHARLA